LGCELLERAKLSERTRWSSGALCVAALAARSVVYLPDFRDRVSFAEAAVEGSPRLSLAHKNLGITRHLAGDANAAEAEYRLALALDPDEPTVHNNLAVIAMSRGQLAEAERLVRRELALDPDHAPARDNLARILTATGRGDEAAQYQRPR
jgi:Flp pilus assembly protein TadD